MVVPIHRLTSTVPGKVAAYARFRPRVQLNDKTKFNAFITAIIFINAMI